MTLPPFLVRMRQLALLLSPKGRPAFPALILAAGIITALCAFNPLWSTNDDIAMSMIAHGYGLAAYGSPYLVFSNVLWGYLVRAIPAINGVLGYSVATLTVLLMIGWAMLYFLLRLGAGYFIGLLAVVLIITLPTLFPQFTMNAGLLTVAAIIGWQVYARLGGVGNLAAACLLAFFGYLIRDMEFLLVLGVALPLLPWRALRERRQMQVAFLLLGVAIASAAALDRWSYSGPEWQRFLEFNSARIPYTDYGAVWHLRQHPEIMARHGYSQNDLNLIGNWFFVDPQIANPKTMNAMRAELGSIYMQEDRVQSGLLAIKTLTHPTLLILILSALLLLLLVPERSAVLAWVLCLAALFVIGVMGRPGQLRIYAPLASLLLIAPLVVGKCKEGVRQWMAVLILIAACIWNTYTLISWTFEFEQGVQEVQRDIHSLPAGPVVSWGVRFPFDFAFPVLANDPHSRDVRFYGLDSFTNAPFSVATAEQKAGRGMNQRLRTAEGVSLIALNGELNLLDMYCMEHLNSQLHEITTHRTPLFTVHQVRCENSSDNFR